MKKYVQTALENVQRNGRKAALVVGGTLATAGTAMAQSSGGAPDMSGITGAVSWSTVVTGIVALGVAVAAVYVAIKGVKTVAHAIKSI